MKEQNAKQKLTVTMLELAQQINTLLFQGQEPIAEYWQPLHSRGEFWEVGDVYSDGTYPAWGPTQIRVDQNALVTIVYKPGVQPPVAQKQYRFMQITDAGSKYFRSIFRVREVMLYCVSIHAPSGCDVETVPLHQFAWVPTEEAPKMWAHFQKHLNSPAAKPALSAETYFIITEKNDYLLEDDILKGECEVWAENVNDQGRYAQRGYKYSWELVEAPPKEWLAEEILNLQSSIKEAKSKIEMFQAFL